MRVVVNEVTLLKAAEGEPRSAARAAAFRDGDVCSPTNSGELRDILAASPGECPVELEFRRADGQRLLMQAGPSHRVSLTPELEARLAGRMSVR